MRAVVVLHSTACTAHTTRTNATACCCRRVVDCAVVAVAVVVVAAFSATALRAAL